ncbi:MAG: hypothetical protein GX829_00420 [Clostridium sp.]|nr:hypothetical protein [Clostridium sp.]
MKLIKNNRIGIILVFLLCVPLFNNIIIVPKEFSDLENRVLTTEIKWDRDMLQSGVLAERVEDFVQDQFPLRNFFVNIKSDVAVLLGKKENNGVYLGKDGYLFGQQSPQSDIFMDNLNAIKTLSKGQDDKISIIAVPLSGAIYEDKLPLGIDSKDQRETLETFKEAVYGLGEYIDISAKFENHKSEPIYFKTDHHWTPYGAYLAYDVLMEKIQVDPIPLEYFMKNTVDSFYGTYYSKFRGNFISSEPFTYYKNPMENLKVNYVGIKDKKNALLFEEYLLKRDKYKMFLGGNDPLVTIKNNQANNNKKVLVLKDSYANAMTPFLGETFKEIHLLDLRYYNLSLKDYMEKENFDEVILLYGMDSYLEQRQLRNMGY